MIKYHATYHRIINDFVGEMGVKLGQKSQNVELLEILDVLPKNNFGCLKDKYMRKLPVTLQNTSEF